MRIKIQQRDLEIGVIGDVSYCPIALAIARAKHIPSSEISVCCDSIKVGDKIYYLTPILREFKDKFDNGEEVKPISFDLL